MTRFLHTSIFVNDLAESIEFYTTKLGLQLLRGPVHHPGNADMAVVGKDWDAYIELVFDLEEHAPYQNGNRFEHLAVEVEGEMGAVLGDLRTKGVTVLRGPKQSPGGGRKIGFVADPNGIEIELLEKR